MKTRILVCILAFVMIFALAAMTACGSQGEKGDKGDKGDTGAAGVGIADVKIEDGKLVVIYTDNNKVELDLPAADVAAACDHTNVTYGELANVPHTYDAKTGVVTPGKYVSVCADCGYAEVVEGAFHTLVNKEIAATCVDNAYTVDKCYCGYEDVASKTEIPNTVAGHKYEFSYAVYQAGNKTVCEDGGLVFEICKVCKDTQSKFYAEGIGHHVTAVTVNTKPGDATVGYISGKCDQCLENVSAELPALTSEVYNANKTLTVTACDKREGTGTYTTYINTELDKDSLTNVKADGLVEVKFDVKLGKVAHMLNGELVADGAVVKYGTANVTELNNMPSNCKDGTLGTGVFTCEVCKSSVGVSTEKDHTYVNIKPIEGQSSTCSVNGKGTADCSVCLEKGLDYTYEKLPHKLTGSVNGTTLTIVCVNEDCDGSADKVVPNVSNVKETASTCKVGGTITYDYVENGVKKSGKVDKAPSAHKLNGVEVNLTEALDAATAGVTELSNDKAVCTDNGTGTFKCSDCGETFGVATKVDHNYDATGATWKNGIKPNCEESATLVLAAGKSCSMCKATEFEIAPTGHKDGFKTAIVGKVMVVQKGCVNENCPDSDNIVTYEIVKDGYVVLVDSTCTATGKASVTYYEDKDNGVKKTVTVSVDKKLHTLGGKNVDLNAPVNPKDYEGLVLLSNKTATCVEYGQAMFNCDVCKAPFGVATTGDHVITTPEVVAPTCENRGYTGGECSVCHEDAYNYTPALGHNYVVTVEDFVATFECATCKALNTDNKDDNDCTCTAATVTVTLDSKDAKTVKVLSKSTCDKNGQTFYKFEVELRDYTTDKYAVDAAPADDAEEYGKKTVEVEYTHNEPTVRHSAANLDSYMAWHETYVDDKGTEDTKDDVVTVYDVVGFVCKDCNHTIVMEYKECEVEEDEEATVDNCHVEFYKAYLEEAKKEAEEDAK